MEGRADYYVYVIFRPNGVPCYVGKGRGKRWKDHARSSSNKRLSRIYALADGELPIWKAQEGLTNAEAIKTEIALISALGRDDKSAGPLVNFTDGGEGMAGIIRSAETRAKLSVAKRGKKNTPEAIAKTAAANRGRKRSAETVARIRAANLGKKRSAEVCQRMSEVSKGRPNPKRAELNRANTGKPKSPQHAAKLREVCARMREHRQPRPKGLPRTAAEIASKPILQKGAPKSEAQKAAMAAARVGRKLSETHKAAIGAAHRGKKRANTENMRAAQQARAEELRVEALARPRTDAGRFVPMTER